MRTSDGLRLEVYFVAEATIFAWECMSFWTSYQQAVGKCDETSYLDTKTLKSYMRNHEELTGMASRLCSGLWKTVAHFSQKRLF